MSHISVDTAVGAAYMHLSDDSVYLTKEVAPGILIDYAEDGSAVGIEFLHDEAVSLFEGISEMLSRS